MKRNLILPLLALAALVMTTGCGRERTVEAAAADPKPGSVSGHEETVAKFQAGQRRFRELIATIKSTESFDAAMPALDRVIADWREVAAALRRLDPPSAAQQAEFRGRLAEGHRETEPVGDGMIALLTVENRETEARAWLEKFAAAGREAGIELRRLYGPADYPAQAAE